MTYYRIIFHICLQSMPISHNVGGISDMDALAVLQQHKFVYFVFYWPVLTQHWCQSHCSQWYLFTWCFLSKISNLTLGVKYCDGQIGQTHIRDCEWTYGTYAALGFEDTHSVSANYSPIPCTYAHTLNCQDNKININKMNNNKNIKMMI